MARRDEEDDESEALRIPPWLMGVGAAVLVFAGVARVWLPRGSGLRLAALAMLGVGALMLVVGGTRAFRTSERAAREPTDAPVDSPSARTARLMLASIGGVVLLGGLVWVTVIAYGGEPATTAWVVVVIGALALLVSAIWYAAAQPRPSRLVEGAPRSPRGRALALAAVGVLLLGQAAAPMRYYLGDDLFDERFSWRMFSAVRVYRCRLEAYETPVGGVEQPTQLMSVIHEAWVNTMRRNREDVLRRYLEWRCEGGEVEAARLVNRCQTPEGNTVPDEVRTIDCDEGVVVDPSEGVAVTVQGGAP